MRPAALALGRGLGECARFGTLPLSTARAACCMSSARLRARDMTLLAGLGSCVRCRSCWPLSGDVKSLARAVPGAEAELRRRGGTPLCGDKNGGAGECACCGIAAWGVGGRDSAALISAHRSKINFMSK